MPECELTTMENILINVSVNELMQIMPGERLYFMNLKMEENI